MSCRPAGRVAPQLLLLSSLLALIPDSSQDTSLRIPPSYSRHQYPLTRAVHTKRRVECLHFAGQGQILSDQIHLNSCISTGPYFLLSVSGYVKRCAVVILTIVDREHILSLDLSISLPLCGVGHGRQETCHITLTSHFLLLFDIPCALSLWSKEGPHINPHVPPLSPSLQCCAVGCLQDSAVHPMSSGDHHIKELRQQASQSPKRVRPTESRSSASSPCLFSHPKLPAVCYESFTHHPAPEYAGRTRPFFSHSVPTRLVSTRSPLLDVPRPVAFSVCDCDREMDFIAQNLVELPALRGCPGCRDLRDEVDGDGQGLTSKGSSASASHRSSKPASPRQTPGVRRLPETEVRLPPITRALDSMGRNTPAFRSAVEKKIPPFPFQRHLTSEAQTEIKEYLRVCKAAHLFSYLSKDILRDRPAEPVDYILDWLKKRRALYGHSKKSSSSRLGTRKEGCLCGSYGAEASRPASSHHEPPTRRSPSNSNNNKIIISIAAIHSVERLRVVEGDLERLHSTHSTTTASAAPHLIHFRVFSSLFLLAAFCERHGDDSNTARGFLESPVSLFLFLYRLHIIRCNSFGMTSLCCVTGVLPYAPGQRRSHASRGATLHLAWVSDDSRQMLGRRHQLCASPEGGETEAEAEAEAPPAGLWLRRLLTVDAPSGQRLELHSPGETCVTAPLPSRQRIAAVLAASAEGDEPTQVCVSDVRGNLYTCDVAALLHAGESLPATRRRTESSAGGPDVWAAVTSSDSTLPAASAAARGWWEKSRGLPGWSGLEALAASQLVSLREFFQDARVVDRGTGEVVRAYSTTHPPTGLHAPAALPTCFLAAEGPLCTLFDTRCPSAALSWEDSINPKAWRGLQPGDDRPSCAAASRLTSISGDVRSVCAAASPNEVAMCIDRAVCIYDVRRFARLHTSSNLLKYDVGSIAPTRKGSAIVCVGIDSEVRVIAVGGPKAGGKGGTTPAQDAGSLAGTFRTRLHQTMCCEETWQGGWAASVNDGGAAAVGVSNTGEVFIAQ
eukprot:gene5611-4031_t